MCDEPEPKLKPGQFLDPTGDAFESQEDIDNLERLIEEEKKKIANKQEKEGSSSSDALP